MHPTWQIQEAKSHFSEVVTRSMNDGPQWVSRHGREAVVIVSAKEFRRLNGQTPTLRATLLNAPRGKALDVTRSREPVRLLEL